MVRRRDPDALLTDARAAQARLDRGEARPLEGIPLDVKDLEDAAGLVTTCRSKLIVASAPAAHDSSESRGSPLNRPWLYPAPRPRWPTQLWFSIKLPVPILATSTVCRRPHSIGTSRKARRCRHAGAKES
jgi:hypothetical protein